MCEDTLNELRTCNAEIDEIESQLPVVERLHILEDACLRTRIALSKMGRRLMQLEQTPQARDAWRRFLRELPDINKPFTRGPNREAEDCES
jgi:hypothetical protein